MGYELRIERSGRGRKKITVEEWRAALASTPGVRLAESQVITATNPKTGEVIQIGGMSDSGEVQFPGEWVTAFRWRNGAAFFNARALEEEGRPVWHAAAALATNLDAAIIGDEDERYDLATGQPVD